MRLLAELRGLEGLLAANEQFAKRVGRAALTGLRRGLRVSRRQTLADYTSGSSFAASIWGGGGAKKRAEFGQKAWSKRLKLSELVTVKRAQVVGNEAITGLKFYGLPRILEGGGRIQAHAIQSRGAKASLAFPARSGQMVFARSVRHPGFMVRRHGFVAANVARDSTAIANEAARSVAELVEETYGLHV